jgi:ribosomal 50S subunit-recycling heat shock protein
MRLDNFISDLGIIKRRTKAKEMADGGHVKVNDKRAKPAYNVKEGDKIEITGRRHIIIRVTKIPPGKSIPKDKRTDYFKVLLDEQSKGFEL